MSLQAREATLKKLKFHIERTQNKIKTQADKEKTEREYNVGD